MKGNTIEKLEKSIKGYEELINSHKATIARIVSNTSSFRSDVDREKALREAKDMIGLYNSKIDEISKEIDKIGGK